MGGRGQSSKSLKQRPGENLLQFKKRQRMDRYSEWVKNGSKPIVNTPSSYGGKGVEGKVVSTTTYDSKGFKQVDYAYFVNGKKTTKDGYENSRPNLFESQWKNRTSTYDRAAKRRASKIDAWMGIGR